MTDSDRSRFTVRMSNDRAYDDIHDTTDLAALQQQEAERAEVERITATTTDADATGRAEGETVTQNDPDLDVSVPGESDTAASGGQGADERYRDGELGGGAIGGSVDDEREKR